MIVKCHMTGWEQASKEASGAEETCQHTGCSGKHVAVREIRVPDEEVVEMLQAGKPVEALLGAAFNYGQNDIQDDPERASVSAGDILELPGGSRYWVRSRGFELMGADEEIDKVTGRAAVFADVPGLV